MSDANIKKYFITQSKIQSPKFAMVLSTCMFVFFVVLALVLIFVPWQQTTSGRGNVISLDPNQRIQDIHTLIGGVVSRWFVHDGEAVKKGDPIVEIVDNDPLFVERILAETEAKRRKRDVSQIAADTAEKNYKRQENLFERGLSSQKDFESAKIKYKKLLSELAQDEADLAKAEIELSRQKIRIVTAPADGVILHVISGAGNVLVKQGDSIARFLPKSQELAIEVFINGNDFPLVDNGREVRIQFEGWPAIQASGWPSLAIGTFEGHVWSLDPSQVIGNRYRVVIVPSPSSKWPENKFLRQGTQAQAWIVLNQVSLGYEIWRRFNGFPLAVNQVHKVTQEKSSEKIIQ